MRNALRADPETRRDGYKVLTDGNWVVLEIIDDATGRPARVGLGRLGALALGRELLKSADEVTGQFGRKSPIRGQ